MEQRSGTKQKNAGISLIEVIVVVLIIGILSAGTVIGFSFIRQMDASSAAKEVSSLLERTKLNTIAAEEGADIRLELKKEGNSYYGVIWRGTTELDKMELSGRLTITVTEDTGAVKTIDDSNSCEFSFKKSNGAFQSTYEKIEIAGSKTAVIYLVTATGRSYMGSE
ncbi:MAG: prepilin-type N-terminal cleavage/methylation domain-containing protein [Lachnospiraceae bacterium]|nr:prepilin-type N-terminal cleavage/methylation domain-containing protein [Lachnospiraceae bacterium]